MMLNNLPAIPDSAWTDYPLPEGYEDVFADVKYMFIGGYTENGKEAGIIVITGRKTAETDSSKSYPLSYPEDLNMSSGAYSEGLHAAIFFPADSGGAFEISLDTNAISALAFDVLVDTTKTGCFFACAQVHR